jgi:multidrug efflux pump subunit AcrA (membrane-fusion protein)
MAITISDTEPRVQYTATAGQVSFSVPFEFFDNADLVVIKTANNADTTLNYNSSPSTALQYSVSGAGQTGGGSISLGGSGATLNDKITIYRNLAIARSTDFPTSGAFQVESLNTELDKIIAMIQQNERDLKFSPKALATTSNTYNLTFPNLEANKVLTVNSSGDGLVFSADIGSYEGNWATATGYNLRDIVKQSSGSDSTTLNNIYICNTAHTSTGSYLTQNDTSNWTLLINVADAANAVVDAEAAQAAAEAAQVAAETAQTAAELAETNAETAETNASETAETNAAASEAAAAASEANAATSESNAATSESNASTFASTATTQAGIATTQAGNASTSASNASTSESNAATSESNAATSAGNAAASAASAATLLDNFDDIYLGSFATDPTVDNDGDPLTAGDLYFNTVSSTLQVYSGSAWQTAAISSTGLVTLTGVETLTNKTLTSPKINEAVEVTATATELNILDGVTATTAELNYSDIVTLGTTAASKVFTADANNLTTVSGAVANVEDTLTDGATITWDVIDSPVAKVTLGGNRTLSAPSGTTPIAGQFISLTVIQDATGSRLLTWNSAYEFTGDTAPTLTTTASKADVFVFKYNGTVWLEVGRNLNLSIT